MTFLTKEKTKLTFEDRLNKKAPGTLPGQTSSGSGDAYIRKYDSSGNEQWTRQFGSSSFERIWSVSTDSSGNVYVSGATDGALPGQTSSGNADAFVRKYDSSGNEQWTRQFGSIGNDRGYGISTDSSGNVYVGGLTSQTLPGQTSSGNDDAFVRKYDSSGNEQWTRQFGSISNDRARSVSTDSLGNVYVVGQATQSLPGQIFLGSHDSFIRKYDSSGNEQWTRQFGTTAADFAYGVSTDSSGNIFISGETDGTFPGQTSSGASDAFVRKYDSSGNEQWTRQFGSIGNDLGNGISTDSSGNVYVGGFITSGALPGQTNFGNGDAFVRKYDSSGNEKWTRQFGANIDDRVWDVATDSAENVYAVGETDTVLPGQTSSGSGDAFVIKFSQVSLIGGEIIPIQTTSLILAGAQSFSWMIPVVLSVLGIGLFVFRKSENS